LCYNLLVTVRPFLRFLLRAVLLAGFVAFVVAALQGPLRLAWLLHQGAYFEAHKEYTRAIAAYEQALELRSQITSHLRIGGIYLAQGRYELAEEEFQEAYWLDPKEEEALLGLGCVAAATGDEGEAMERWMEVLTLDETNREAHYRLGRAYIGRSQWSSAQEELEKAARHGEGEARFWLGLLLAREDQGLAVSYLEEVVRGGDPASKEASDLISALERLKGAEEADLAAGLGHIYLRHGLPNLAREELARAVSLDPEQHLARSYLGYTLWSLGEYEEARKVLREALRLDPHSPLNHYFLALLHRSKGYPEVAVLEFQKALELDPDNAAVCAEMASTYLGKRDYPAAREWYRAAVERAPGEVEFHLLQAEFHLEHLLWLDDGLAAAQMAVALDPENAMAWDLLGWGQYLTQRPKEARSSLERAIVVNPDLASAYYHLGVVYEQERLKEEAEWAYRRAIDLDTEGLYRERAEKALKKLTGSRK
jgi:tetratricopeptide (TPR) repeat protein